MIAAFSNFGLAFPEKLRGDQNDPLQKKTSFKKSSLTWVNTKFIQFYL